jgi:hypothetical protein
MCFAKDDIQRGHKQRSSPPALMAGCIHTHTYGQGFYAPALARAIKCRQRAGGGNLYICGGHSAAAATTHSLCAPGSVGRFGVCYMVTLYYTARGHVS